LYRNGFRVLPYGEPNNDWLGLDASVRKRIILPVHGNNNFIGFVEIDDENDNFQELSSREGVFYNEAYEELIDFVYKALTATSLALTSSLPITIGRSIATGGYKQRTSNHKSQTCGSEGEVDYKGSPSISQEISGNGMIVNKN